MKQTYSMFTLLPAQFLDQDKHLFDLLHFNWLTLPLYRSRSYSLARRTSSYI